MKRKIILSFMLVALLGFSTSAFAIDEARLKSDVSKAIMESMEGRGLKVNVKVDILKELSEPAGYVFVKLTFYKKDEPGKIAGEQYVFTDGKFVVQDFLYIDSMASVSKELMFDLSKSDIDVKNMTPVIGKAGAKHVLVEVSDFQCPYCIQMNDYLHKKLKNRKDVVVYLMHLPLRQIHPRAEILAKVFEAGMMMNKNFATSLYDPTNGNLSEDEIVDKYAKLSGNVNQFKKLVTSKEVADKVKNAEAQATKLGLTSTPGLFINGKMISGFDPNLMDKAIGNLK